MVVGGFFFGFDMLIFLCILKNLLWFNVLLLFLLNILMIMLDIFFILELFWSIFFKNFFCERVMLIYVIKKDNRYVCLDYKEKNVLMFVKGNLIYILLDICYNMYLNIYWFKLCN